MSEICILVEGRRRVHPLTRLFGKLLGKDYDECLVLRANVPAGEATIGNLIDPAAVWSPILQAALDVFDGEVDRAAVTDGEYQLAAAIRMTPDKYRDYLKRFPVRFTDIPTVKSAAERESTSRPPQAMPDSAFDRIVTDAGTV